MIYAVTVLAAACCVLGFLLVCALVGGSDQRDELQARIEHRDARIEALEAELRRRSMGNHPAGRGLRGNEAVDAPAVLRVRALLQAVPDADADALREACEDRDAEHEGGAGA